MLLRIFFISFSLDIVQAEMLLLVFSSFIIFDINLRIRVWRCQALNV